MGEQVEERCEKRGKGSVLEERQRLREDIRILSTLNSRPFVFSTPPLIC